MRLRQAARAPNDEEIDAIAQIRKLLEAELEDLRQKARGRKGVECAHKSLLASMFGI